jgi:hypothetical protein
VQLMSVPRWPVLHRPAIPRVPVAAVLLTAVYLAAFAVAVAAPGQRAGPGLVVLAGLTARVVARRRRSTAEVRRVPVCRAKASATRRRPLSLRRAV